MRIYTNRIHELRRVKMDTNENIWSLRDYVYGFKFPVSIFKDLFGSGVRGDSVFRIVSVFLQHHSPLLCPEPLDNHTSDEDARVHDDVFHEQAIPEERYPGEGAGGVHGHDAHGSPRGSNEFDELIGEGALTDPRRFR